MPLHPIDMAIVIAYLILNALIGVYVQKKATANADAYFLADRNVPWWMLGLSGCSSYIDIGGTMALVGAMFYLGVKSIWMTHIFWGWLIICFYMAFQAKYIRRSGVMTFAEWNVTRFGDTRDTEHARIAAASFLLILMVFNLMFMAVGTGKFAEEFLPFSRWQSSLIVFGIVGLIGNLIGLLILASGRSANLNMRAAFLEVVNDALGSVAVLAAAAVITTTGWYRADAIASILIGVLIIPRTIRLLRETIDVLLESTPKGLDLELVRQHLHALPHVHDVHDLHASQVATGIPILTAHLVVDDTCFHDGHLGELLDQVQACIHTDFGIEHSTIQFESVDHAAHEHATHE